MRVVRGYKNNSFFALNEFFDYHLGIYLLNDVGIERGEDIIKEIDISVLIKSSSQ